jgi:hypothetical protein
MEYGSLREKIAAEKAERQGRYAKFEAAYAEAYKAGCEAAAACTPTPMVVAERSNPLNDLSAVRQAWHVPEGVCGFAWVKIPKGNSSFARWLAKVSKARKSYYGGFEINIREYGQSMQRKEAHARAMAKVLNEKLGVEAYADSRMD